MPTEAYGAAMGAHMALGDIAAGPDSDTNADALRSLEHIQTLREHATSAVPVTIDRSPGYLIEADDLESVEGLELAFDLPEGVRRITIRRMSLTVYRETLVPRSLRIEALGETDDGYTFPVLVEQENWRHLAFSNLFEPRCSRNTLTFGDREHTAVVMRTYVELNAGPPSQEKQATLLADAMEDFESYNCH